MKLYSYIIKNDYGLAPNPFWEEITLNICKPKIRLSAEINDWVVGTGSKYVKTKSGETRNHSGRLVYAMRVTNKMSMCEYDKYCLEKLKGKIPFIDKNECKRIVGDSIYDYSHDNQPRLRKVIHTEKDRKRDLSGKNTLLSTEFYYFGNRTERIPPEFSDIIKKEQGHLVIRDITMLNGFLKWLRQNFEKNKLYGEPQLQWQIDKWLSGKCKIKCTD